VGTHQTLIEVGLGQQAAYRDRGEAEGQRVPAAAPVQVGREQGREQQVEGHLIGQ
jgi:hypothetical protein